LSCGLTFLWGRLHREKKDWEKKCFPITGPPQREEVLRERKMKRFLNFYWSMPQWIFWEDNISFVVFGAVDWPSSGVDYTERRKTERKKENVSPLHHRPYNTERRNIKRNKNETVFKFLLKYATMNEWMRGEHKFL